MSKPFYLLILVNLFLFSCENEKDTVAIENQCEPQEIVPFEEGTICNPKIMSFHFGLENLSVPDQIRSLSNLEIDGLIVEINENNINDLDAYFNDCNVKNGNFNIYNLFTTVCLDEPNQLINQLSTIEDIYKKIENKNTRLQVLFKGTKNNNNTVNVMSSIAEIASNYNKSLIIYPHATYSIETAEEAMTYINIVNKDNVFLAVHLCHELAAGNGNRINEVVTNVAPYIKSVSISGASLEEQFASDLPLWFWGIKPLNMGTYDYSTFYQSLLTVNYSGPIAIHTWGILNNFGIPFQNHLPNSRQILLDMSEDICF